MVTRALNRILPQFVMTAVVVSGVACANRLKDYTQMTLQASPLESGSAMSPEILDTTKAIVETRLLGLGVEHAEITTAEPDKIIVRLPELVNARAAEAILTSTGKLYFRNQKPDTEAELAENIEDLQRLLIEQNTLTQADRPADEQTDTDALQVQIDELRGAIASLFEPTNLTGELLYNAEIQPADTGSDIWDVHIQFDGQGADMFAAQTKEMAGTGRSIGLFLDDVLLSTPQVSDVYEKTGITVGSAVISGNFTKAAAKDLQVQLQSGALPVLLKTVELCRYQSGEGACWNSLEAAGL